MDSGGGEGEGGYEPREQQILFIINRQIMSRQSWRAQEDEAINRLVKEEGIYDWTRIAFKLQEFVGMQRRTGKQCRERWYNHLSPTVNKLPWTQQEEELLFVHHKHYGNRWKDISKLFVGRTDNDIKNHFYSTLRRSLRRLNKIVGEKNSTTQMREIKPSVLSTIMNCIYEQQHNQPSGLVESLRHLPILIFEFARFKPVKLNIKSANIEAIREQTNEIFTLISKFNDEYEQNKEFQRSLKSERRLKKLAFSKSSSEQDPSVKLEELSNKSEACENQECGRECEGWELCEKMEESCEDKDHQPDHQHNKQTEFSLANGPFESYHQEIIPLDLMSQGVSASKASIKEAGGPEPSHNRTFSLEADEIHDMHFNEPEEPSKMLIEDPCEFGWHSHDPEQMDRDLDQFQLIDEVISTRIDR